MVKKDTAKGAVGGVVAGLGLAAAAAAGAFFLYGSKDAAKNRKKVKGWALKAKGEVLEGIEKLNTINEEAYNKIVDKVSEKYKKVKNIDMADVEGFTKELKGYWKNLKREFMPVAKKPATKKKVAKKA